MVYGRLALTVALTVAASGAEAGVRVHSHRHLGARPHAVVVRKAVVVRTPMLRVTALGPVSVKAGHGRLHVEVEPDRARVYIDGRYVGRGDATPVLSAGRHTVRVVLSDGRQASETVHVDAGRLTRVRLDLN